MNERLETQIVQLSRFVAVCLVPEGAIVQCARASDPGVLVSIDSLGLLHAFARPAMVRDVLASVAAASRSAARAVIDQCVEASILISPASERRPELDPEGPFDAASFWEWHDLWFWRLGREAGSTEGEMPTPLKVGPGGAWLPFANRAVRPALYKPPMGDDVLLLPESEPLPDAGYGELLQARRSVRRFVRRSIPQRTLSQLLQHSVRKDHRPDGVFGPHPSGGGIYSLEYYLVLGDIPSGGPRQPGAVEGVEPGLYHYCPRRHALEALGAPTLCQKVLDRAQRASLGEPPPVVFLIASRIARQGYKYRGVTLTVILQEVGCVYQTLHLTCGALGLGGCAYGGPVSTTRDLAEVTGIDELEEPLVGQFGVGIPWVDP